MKLSLLTPKGNEINSSQNDQKTNQKIKDVNEFVYSKADVPLDFSFKKLKSLEQLRKIEPRKGTRRAIEDASLEENDKTENRLSENNRSNPGIIFEDEVSEKNEKSREIQSHKKFSSNSLHFQTTESKESNNQKSVLQKKKVKYVTYTNSIILHSNKLSSIDNIHNVLGDILPDIDFSLVKNVSKIEMVQWIDISHNYIQSISRHILNLPFLKILYCHGNIIKEIENVTVLKNCKSLMNLTLHGNPIAQIKGYRQYIIEIIPSLEKLDFNLVSEKELDVVFHRSSRFGEKRDKITGEVVEYPKLDEEIIKRFKSVSEIDD